MDQEGAGSCTISKEPVAVLQSGDPGGSERSIPAVGRGEEQWIGRGEEQWIGCLGRGSNNRQAAAKLETHHGPGAWQDFPDGRLFRLLDRERPDEGSQRPGGGIDG